MFCYCAQQAGGAAAQLQQQLSEEVIVSLLNTCSLAYTSVHLIPVVHTNTKCVLCALDDLKLSN
jgi:hypothetical protein